MLRSKAISAIIVLVLLWLLIGLASIISTAENIPLSELQLEKIGLNKIRLESGIGVLVFNLSKYHDKLTGSGYVVLSNTHNESVLVNCHIITKMSPVDLDEYGNPRIHEVISNSVIFDAIPDGSWLTLEDDKATIKPYHQYKFRYNLNIPLSSEYKFDTGKGFLVYINIKKKLENASGMNIGIDYSYKLFIYFEGKLEQSNLLTYLILIIGPATVISVSVIIYKRVHKKSVEDASRISKPALNTKGNVEKVEGLNDKPIFILGGGNDKNSKSGGKN